MRPATTKAGRPRARMKWDRDTNIFIMRTYFTVTKLETELTTYRHLLHREFIQQYPNCQVSEQRLSDQRRVIVRNKLLSDEIIQKIKDEVQHQLNIDTHDETIANAATDPTNNSTEVTSDEGSTPATTSSTTSEETTQQRQETLNLLTS